MRVARWAAMTPSTSFAIPRPRVDVDEEDGAAEGEAAGVLAPLFYVFAFCGLLALMLLSGFGFALELSFALEDKGGGANWNVLFFSTVGGLASVSALVLLVRRLDGPRD